MCTFDARKTYATSCFQNVTSIILLLLLLSFLIGEPSHKLSWGKAEGKQDLNLPLKSCGTYGGVFGGNFFFWGSSYVFAGCYRVSYFSGAICNSMVHDFRIYGVCQKACPTHRARSYYRRGKVAAVPLWDESCFGISCSSNGTRSTFNISFEG